MNRGSENTEIKVTTAILLLAMKSLELVFKMTGVTKHKHIVDVDQNGMEKGQGQREKGMKYMQK